MSHLSFPSFPSLSPSVRVFDCGHTVLARDSLERFVALELLLLPLLLLLLLLRTSLNAVVAILTVLSPCSLQHLNPITCMTRVIAGEVAVRASAVNLMLAAVGDELIVAHDS